MKGSDVSKTQLEVILKLTEPGSPGILERWDGGFWTVPTVAWEWVHRSDTGKNYRSPAWSVTVQTVRAMERAGLVRRLYRYPEEWRDPRELTDAWLALGLRELAPGGYAENKKSAAQLQAERDKASLARWAERQKIRQLRDGLKALEAERKAALARLVPFAKAAQRRTVVEPTRSVLGDDCRVTSEERRLQLRAEIETFYEARRLAATAGIAAEEARLRRDLEFAEERASGHSRTAARASGSLRSMRKAEGKAESDAEVLRNIDAELVPIWEVVKKSITGSAKRSRTEAFLHWVEENPDEIQAILAEHFQGRGLEAELERAQYEQAAEYEAARAEPTPEDDEVPF